MDGDAIASMIALDDPLGDYLMAEAGGWRLLLRIVPTEPAPEAYDPCALYTPLFGSAPAVAEVVEIHQAIKTGVEQAPGAAAMAFPAVAAIDHFDGG